MLSYEPVNGLLLKAFTPLNLDGGKETTSPGLGSLVSTFQVANEPVRQDWGSLSPHWGTLLHVLSSSNHRLFCSAYVCRFTLPSSPKTIKDRTENPIS